MFSAGDFADLYADLGVMATYTPPSGLPVVGRLVFSAPGKVELGGEVLTTEPSARYATAAFPNVVRQGVFAITGNGNWRVRQAPQPMEDGAEMRCPLERMA